MDAWEPNWILTEEREPEENKRYLVTVFFNGKIYVDIDDYFCYGWDDYGDAVIAWAELPAPCKRRKRKVRWIEQTL